MNNHPDWLKKTFIAHRGLHDSAKSIFENTIGAFEKAIEHKYAIELDVYVTTDQEVIVFHDDNLKRMCGVDRHVHTLSSADLKYYPIQRTGEHIPLLKDVLKVVDGDVPLLIEIKKQAKGRNANMVILNSLLGYRGDFAIQSFNPFTMGWFAKYAPLIIRGQLASDFRSEKMNPVLKYLLKKFKLNFISRPNFLAYDVRNMPDKLVERKRRKGNVVIGWTLSNETEYKKVKDFCDNIIFEGFLPGTATT